MINSVIGLVEGYIQYTLLIITSIEICCKDIWSYHAGSLYFMDPVKINAGRVSYSPICNFNPKPFLKNN